MRERLLRDSYVVVAVVLVALRLLAVEPWTQSVDAFAYWATRSGDVYQGAEAGRLGAFLYSPAFMQLLTPVTWLPWPVFSAIWTAVLCIAYRILAGRLALPLLLFIPVPFELISGNVHLLIALAVVYGFRWPVVWAFPILTKVTPGIGLVWFLVRGEWRALAIAGAGTAAVVAVSFTLAPTLWAQWIGLLTRDANGVLVTEGWYLPVPLAVRLPIAVAIAAWGARYDKRWAVLIASTVALPIVWLNSFAMLAALPALTRDDRTAPAMSASDEPLPRAPIGLRTRRRVRES